MAQAARVIVEKYYGKLTLDFQLLGRWLFLVIIPIEILHL